MVTSMNQAVKIQQLRVEQGKRGYAKAVQHFLMRDMSGYKSFNWGHYQYDLSALPCIPNGGTNI